MADIKLENELKEIKEKLIAPMTEVQKRADELDSKFDSLSTSIKDSATKETADLLEKYQQVEGVIKAQEKQIKDMEDSYKSLELSLVSSNSTVNKEFEGSSDVKSAFSQYLRHRTPMSQEIVHKGCEELAEQHLKHAGEFEINTYKKELIGSSNPQGGYWVPPELSNQIAKKIFETSPIMQVANVVTTSSDTYQIIIDDNESGAGWIGETGTRAETTTPDIGIINIPVHEEYAEPKISSRLIEDAGFDVENWIQNKVSGKLNRLFNTSAVTGDGSQKPRGFLSLAASSDANVYERGTVGQLTSTTSGGIAPEDLVSLQGLLKEEYQANAIWGMQRQTFSDNVLSLKGSDGHFIFNRDMFFQGGSMTLLGRPVVFMNDMQAVSADNLSVVYADFSEFYTVVQKLGFMIIRDEITSKRFVKLHVSRRIGGDVSNYDAGKILKILT